VHQLIEKSVVESFEFGAGRFPRLRRAAGRLAALAAAALRAPSDRSHRPGAGAQPEGTQQLLMAFLNLLATTVFDQAPIKYKLLFFRIPLSDRLHLKSLRTKKKK